MRVLSMKVMRLAYASSSKGTEPIYGEDGKFLELDVSGKVSFRQWVRDRLEKVPASELSPKLAKIVKAHGWKERYEASRVRKPKRVKIAKSVATLSPKKKKKG